MHDHNERTVHSVANHVFVRRQRADAVRVLDIDGAECRVLGRPVFRLHRRGVRAKIAGHIDVGHERVLLRRFTDIHSDLLDHPGMEAHRTH